MTPLKLLTATGVRTIMWAVAVPPPSNPSLAASEPQHQTVPSRNSAHRW